MCEPITIATALTVAATAYGVYSTDQTVKTQNKFSAQAAKEGSKLANAAFIEQAGQARLREAQEAEAASQELTQNAKRGAEARSSASVAAGEAGVTGLSVEALINDFYDQEGTYGDSVKRNLELSQDQSNAELRGFRSNALDRSLALRRPGEQRPSYLAGALTMGGQIAGGYARYKYPDKVR